MNFPTDSELKRLEARLYESEREKTKLSADSLFIDRDLVRRMVDSVRFAKERYVSTRIRQTKMIQSAACREGGLKRAANMEETKK